MKTIFIAMIVLVLGCSHREVASNAEAVPEKSNAFTDGDILRLQELSRIRYQVGSDIWPGFGREELGMVLVDRHLQWALDIDEPPSYYVRAEIPVSLRESVQTMSVTQAFRDWQGELLPEPPAALYRAFSKEQTGNHYRQSVFFVKTFSEYQRTGDKMNSEEWIHISFHELFHVFQDRYVRYTPEFMKAMNVPFKDKIRDDEDHKKILEPELKLLTQAVCVPEVSKAKKHLKEAMKLRQKRWDYIAKKYGVRPDTWERYDSWAEGTASYAEHQMMSKWAQFAEQTLLAKDPSFKGFESYKLEHKEAWCETLGMPRSSYWSSLGFAYSLIMDRLDVDWKNKRPTTQFFDGYFRDLGLMPK